MFTELVPAYGRDYKSQKAVKLDWNNGKDFKNPATGQYVNKMDMMKYAPDVNVMIRYQNLSKVVAI